MSAPTAEDRKYISGLGKIIFGLTAMLYLGIYLFLGYFSGDQLRSFGSALKIKADLGLCSDVFARLVITHVLCTFLAFVTGSLLLLATLLDIFTYKRSFAVYRKSIFANSMMLLLVPLPWVFGNVFIAKRFDLFEACLISKSALPISVYFGLFLGFFATMVATGLPMIAQYFVQNNIDPAALSNDPEMRARQLAARSMFGYKEPDVAKKHQAKRRSAFSFYRFLAAIAVFFSFMTLLVPAARVYHGFSWTPVQATILSMGEKCVFEYREILKRSANGSVKKAGPLQHTDVFDCTAGKTLAANNPNFEFKSESRPHSQLHYFYGTREITVFVNSISITPDVKPAGSIISIVANPDDPTRVDRLFHQRDWKHTAQGLFSLLVAAFFEWLHARSRRTAAPVTGPITGGRRTNVFPATQIAPQLMARPFFEGNRFVVVLKLMPFLLLSVFLFLEARVAIHTLDWTKAVAQVVAVEVKCELSTKISRRRTAQHLMPCSDSEKFRKINSNYNWKLSRVEFITLQYTHGDKAILTEIPLNRIANKTLALGDRIDIVASPKDPKFVDRLFVLKDLWNSLMISLALVLLAILYWRYHRPQMV